MSRQQAVIAIYYTRLRVAIIGQHESAEQRIIRVSKTGTIALGNEPESNSNGRSCK